MSENVVEEFSAKSTQALQASILLAQELMRVVNARLQASAVEEATQVKQLKTITDVAIENARNIAKKLESETFYTLAPKTDLYDAYVCAHSFAFDPYCAGKVEEANQRLGLSYKPGSLSDADCAALRQQLGIAEAQTVAKPNFSNNDANVFYDPHYRIKEENLSLVDRIKASKGFDRGVLIIEGGKTKRLTEIVTTHKPIPTPREHTYTQTKTLESKNELKL